MPGMIGVAHGEWRIPTTDPPSGDYLALLVADQGVWRITSVDDTWEPLGITDLTHENRFTSPPGLPAVWYAWRGAFPNVHLVKTANNGSSWTPLANDPMVPTGADGLGEFAVWEDHTTAASAGILLTAKWSSTGGVAGPPLYLVNIYYTLDDGASWSQVFDTDLGVDNTEAAYSRENLVVNTAYAWYARGDAAGAKRISHSGGSASLTTIAMPAGPTWNGIDMLACDSTLDGGIVYAVAQAGSETGRRILRTSALAPTQFVEVTPAWGLTDDNLGNVWIAVAGDVVMALAFGVSGGDDTGSIWRSTNAGLTWNMVHSWDTNLNCRFSVTGYKAVGVNPARPQTWFVWANNHDLVLGSRVYRTPDQGETWIAVPLPSADPSGDDDQLYYEVRVLG